MARHQAGLLTYFGGFLMLVACILLLITSISAPVVSDISIMDVTVSSTFNPATPTTRFGTFGYCYSGFTVSERNTCSVTTLGYDPAAAIREYAAVNFADYSTETSAKLTKAMVLHPIVCGLAFLTFCLASAATFVGHAAPTLLALLTCLANLAVLVTDFVGFGIIYAAVNDSNVQTASAEWGAGVWTMVAGFCCSLLSVIVLIFAAVWAAIRKRRAARKAVPKEGPLQDGYAPPEPRRRFF